MNRLLCKVFGHKDETVSRLSSGSRRVRCRRCGKEWGVINMPGGEIRVPWGPKLDELTDKEKFMKSIRLERNDE